MKSVHSEGICKDDHLDRFNASLPQRESTFVRFEKKTLCST